MSTLSVRDRKRLKSQVTVQMLKNEGTKMSIPFSFSISQTDVCDDRTWISLTGDNSDAVMIYLKQRINKVYNE